MTHPSRPWPWRVLRGLLLSLALMIGLVLTYLLTAFLLSSIHVPAEAADGEDVEIYLLSNGVHTDMVLPVRNADMDWTTITPYTNTSGKDTTAQWVGIGWGDKGFYLEIPTWADLTFRIAFRAAFGLGSSAMHATFHGTPTVGPACKRLTLSHAQYQRLVRYILSSFAYDASGRSQAIATDANYGTNDAFYEGVGRYTLFHTCNTWTNNALKSCGQQACLWTPFQGAIMDKYE